MPADEYEDILDDIATLEDEDWNRFRVTLSGYLDEYIAVQNMQIDELRDGEYPAMTANMEDERVGDAATDKGVLKLLQSHLEDSDTGETYVTRIRYMQETFEAAEDADLPENVDSHSYAAAIADTVETLFPKLLEEE